MGLIFQSASLFTKQHHATHCKTDQLFSRLGCHLQNTVFLRIHTGNSEEQSETEEKQQISKILCSTSIVTMLFMLLRLLISCLQIQNQKGANYYEKAASIQNTPLYIKIFQWSLLSDIKLDTNTKFF